MDECALRARSGEALEALRDRSLGPADERGFDVEGGVEKREFLLEEPEEAKFVLSSDPPARRIWVSALAAGFELAWSDEPGAFTPEKTGEALSQVLSRIPTPQLGTFAQV